MKSTFEIPLLVAMLDEAYQRKAWHGPNLRGSIRGLAADQAAWRPAPKRHSVAEQVLHAAYWKHSVRRRLKGDLRGSFPVKGSNWFPVPGELAENEWKSHVRLLDAEQRSLREAVAGLPDSRLEQAERG